MDESSALSEHEWMVATIVQRIARRLPEHIDRDDLMAAGRIGLLDAIRRYDPSRGTKFSTMAWHRIRGAVRDELRGMDHLSRRQRQREREVPGTNGVHAKAPDSLQRIMGDADGIAVIETLSDPDATDPADDTHRSEVSKIVRDAIAGLPDRERLVVEWCDLAGRTLEDVGTELGVSASRVSQLKSDAHRTLARMLGDDTLPANMRPRRFFGTKVEVKEAASMLGRAGGLKGGPARAASLSPTRRSEISRAGAEKRWGHKVAPRPITAHATTTAQQMLEQIEHEIASLTERIEHLRKAAEHLRAIVLIESRS